MIVFGICSTFALCDVFLKDEENLREGLRFARDVLGELRSSQLNPQKYYELYMEVFDQLIHLRVPLSHYTSSTDHFFPSLRVIYMKSKRKRENLKTFMNLFNMLGMYFRDCKCLNLVVCILIGGWLGI